MLNWRPADLSIPFILKWVVYKQKNLSMNYTPCFVEKWYKFFTICITCICTHFKHSWPWSKGYFYEENNPTNCVTFVVFCVYTTPNLFCLKTYVVIWSQTMYKDSHKVSCCVQHVSIVTKDIQLLNLHQGKYPNKNQFNIFIDTNEY